MGPKPRSVLEAVDWCGNPSAAVHEVVAPDGHAIVVDFKFGREREEHLHQVREYMDLLRKMGYPRVEGHIWYVYTNKIINC